MTSRCPDVFSATRAAAPAPEPFTPLATATLASNVNTMAVNLTGGETLNVGDVFNIAAVNQVNPMTREVLTPVLKQFVVTQPLTAVGGGGDVITFSPTLYGPGSQDQVVLEDLSNDVVLKLASEGMRDSSAEVFILLLVVGDLDTEASALQESILLELLYNAFDDSLAESSGVDGSLFGDAAGALGV